MAVRSVYHRISCPWAASPSWIENYPTIATFRSAEAPTAPAYGKINANRYSAVITTRYAPARHAPGGFPNGRS